MSQNESVAHFVRTINELHYAIKSRLENLVTAYSDTNQETRLAACNLVFESLNDLDRVLSSHDKPAWLSPLQRATSACIRKGISPGTTRELLDTIINFRVNVINHTWNFDKPSPVAVLDFDAIYNEQICGSRIPSLFEKLIADLEALIHSGFIDSRKAIEQLEKLVALLKRNSKGSWTSIYLSWRASQIFVTHLTVNTLEKIPGLDVLIKTIKGTLSQLDVEMEKTKADAEQHINKDIRQVYSFPSSILITLPENGSIPSLPSPATNSGSPPDDSSFGDDERAKR